MGNYQAIHKRKSKWALTCRCCVGVEINLRTLEGHEKRVATNCLFEKDTFLNDKVAEWLGISADTPMRFIVDDRVLSSKDIVDWRAHIFKPLDVLVVFGGVPLRSPPGAAART